MTTTGFDIMMPSIIVYDEPDCPIQAELSDNVFTDLPKGLNHLLNGNQIMSIKVSQWISVDLFQAHDYQGDSSFKIEA